MWKKQATRAAGAARNIGKSGTIPPTNTLNTISHWRENKEDEKNQSAHYIRNPKILPVRTTKALCDILPFRKRMVE